MGRTAAKADTAGLTANDSSADEASLSSPAARLSSSCCLCCLLLSRGGIFTKLFTDMKELEGNSVR